MNRGRTIKLFIAGAQKCGTTSLKHYLGEHPEIYTHPQKEFAFFYDDREFEQGHEKAFDKYFMNENNCENIIAKNAGLYVKEEAIARLKNHNPDCKIVLILRDPVERTYSAYNMEYNYGSLQEPFDHIIDVIKNKNSEDWKFNVLIGMSIYSQHLNMILRYFQRENVRIIDYSDLKNDSIKVTQDIYRWLEVDDTIIPQTNIRHNQTFKTKSRFLSQLIKKVLGKENFFKTTARMFLPKKHAYQLGEMIRDANKSDVRYNRISPETDSFLRNYFKPYNEELSKLTGMDFSHWNKESS